MKHVSPFLFASLFFLTARAQDDLNKILQEQLKKSQEEQLKGGVITTGTGQTLITPEILWSLKRVADPQISPDGKWVLFQQMSYALDANKSNSDLYIIPITGGAPKQLTTSPAADYNARWSPDGKKIAFISARDGTPQMYMMNMSGGDPMRITNMSEGVANLCLSPKGNYFSFTSDVKLEKTVLEKYPDLPKVNVRIYERLPIRHWDNWEDEKYSHLFMIPSSGGEARDLMPGEAYDVPLRPFGDAGEISWSPDEKEIAYTCKKITNPAESTNSDIFIVPITGGAARNITQGMMGFDRDPLYSSDGKWIAFKSMKRAGNEADRNRLMLYDRQSGEITELSSQLDQWVGNAKWAPDGKSIYFTAEDKATVQIYQMQVADRSWKILTKGWFNHDQGFDVAQNGLMIVTTRRNMNRAGELYTVSLQNGNETQLTDANGETFKHILPAKIEERWFTAKDGKKFQSWVILPPDFDPKKKYPMITYCQGGPQSTVSQFFSYAWNFLLMASKGYVVVAPNRRGLPGFGQEWNDAISQNWGGKPMQDILVATDEMMKEKYIDKDRCAAIGASAGGYAVFWLAGNHKKRFKAFISHCGVFNLESMYGATEELWFVNWENGGPYWDSKVKSIYDMNSAHRFAQNWDTPILIITGEKDFRVPYTQSLEAFTVAQTKGIPSKLIIYPNENHWVLHAQEQILWFREFYDWLEKWCGKQR